LLDAYKLKLSAYPEWQISTAIDGEDAIAAVKKDIPDLIILDIIMPKKSGIDVLLELKADPKTNKIPIIIASNIDQKSVVSGALKAGAVDYFVKSDITITDLVAKCNRYL
jgi:DNA-binding response OmpR family regulator